VGNVSADLLDDPFCDRDQGPTIAGIRDLVQRNHGGLRCSDHQGAPHSFGGEHMSRFRTALRVVPVTAWIIAAIVYLAAAIAIGIGNWEKTYDVHDPEPIWAFSLLVALAPLVLVAWVLLIGYVNGDARRRGMRYTIWTLLAIFTPSGIGMILYFLFREPVLRSCPSCGARNKAGLSYCPNCGHALARVCPGCNRPVDEEWNNCAHCGLSLRGRQE